MKNKCKHFKIVERESFVLTKSGDVVKGVIKEKVDLTIALKYKTKYCTYCNEYIQMNRATKSHGRPML